MNPTSFLTTSLYPVHSYFSEIIAISTMLLSTEKAPSVFVKFILIQCFKSQHWWEGALPNFVYVRWVAGIPATRVVFFGLRETKSHMALFYEENFWNQLHSFSKAVLRTKLWTARGSVVMSRPVGMVLQTDRWIHMILNNLNKITGKGQWKITTVTAIWSRILGTIIYVSVLVFNRINLSPSSNGNFKGW